MCSRSRRASSRTTSSMRCNPIRCRSRRISTSSAWSASSIRSESKPRERCGTALARRHRRTHDHRRPCRHRRGHRQGARARTRRDQRDRAASTVRRRTGPADAAAPRVRSGLARGQAPSRACHASARADRGDDRRRGQRRGRTQTSRHRRGHGVRQRSHEASRPDDPHRRQLRDARQRGADRPTRLREDRLVRPLPDDAAAGARHAVHRRDDLRRERRRRAHAAHGHLPSGLRDRGRRRDHRARSGRSRRHAPSTPRSEGADHQPHCGDPLDHLRRACSRRRHSCRSSPAPTSPARVIPPRR